MTPEQTHLMERAKEDLNAALFLFNSDHRHSAISTAFFAMLFAAKAVLLTKRFGHSKHAAIVAAFNEHFVQTGEAPEALFQSLLTACEESQTFNYEFATQKLENVETRATLQIKRAEEFLAFAERYFGAQQ